eukprot:9477455-Pyramimonas_sp.AAC.1
MRGTHAGGPAGSFGGASYGTTKSYAGFVNKKKPNWAWGMHAGGPTGGFGGVPYGATKRCTGWVKKTNWVSGTHADGPTEGFGWKCQIRRPGRCRWGLRWSSL